MSPSMAESGGDDSKATKHSKNNGRADGKMRPCRRPSVSELVMKELQRQGSNLRPETTSGYSTVAALLVALAVAYEVRLQRQLTAPPVVFGQIQRPNEEQNQRQGLKNHPFSQILAADVYQAMIQQSKDPNIIQRPIQPSLFVGTRAIMSSTVAYLIQHDEQRLHRSPKQHDSTAALSTTDSKTINTPQPQQHFIQFREVMKIPSDGATVAIDWEFLYDDESSMSIEQWKNQILHGPISKPVVLILHGINNHTGFGYIQNMMHLCCQQDWIAAGMNFRGCSVKLSTPRTYNGAYTGDLRSVVQKLSARLLQASGASPPTYQPLFLVGNSLGANLVAKYLGEEGRCNTLPSCVAGGVTMGNPMKIDSRTMSPIFSPVIALGAKRGLYSVYPTLKAMIQSSAQFQLCIRNAWKAISLADYDRAMAPIFCRNDPSYPFGYRVGYDSAEDYWKDASSSRQVSFISIPFLQLIARDDFLVYHPFRKHLYCNVMNPYIMVMETTCGGHLGWHEAVTSSKKSGWDHWLFGSSWADNALVEFIQAILDVHAQQQQSTDAASPCSPSMYSNEKPTPIVQTVSKETVTTNATACNKMGQIRSRL